MCGTDRGRSTTGSDIAHLRLPSVPGANPPPGRRQEVASVEVGPPTWKRRTHVPSRPCTDSCSAKVLRPSVYPPESHPPDKGMAHVSIGYSVMSRVSKAAVCAATSLLIIGLFVAMPTPAQASTVRYYHALISASRSGTHYSYWYWIPAAATVRVDYSCGKGGYVEVVDTHGTRMWGRHALLPSHRARYSRVQANRSAREQFITHSAGGCRIEVTAWKSGGPARVPSCHGRINDADGPDVWTGCWPGRNSTGVPPGTALKAVTGPLYITRPGTVIDRRSVNGGIVVQANGVTIRNTKVTNGGIDFPGYWYPGARLTISHVTINCGGRPGTSGIGEDGVTVDRTNISGCENGFDADQNFTITNTYVHDLVEPMDCTPCDPHTDGLQSAISSKLVLDHNVIYADHVPSGNAGGGTSAWIMGIQKAAATRSSRTTCWPAARTRCIARGKVRFRTSSLPRMSSRTVRALVGIPARSGRGVRADGLLQSDRHNVQRKCLRHRGAVPSDS